MVNSGRKTGDTVLAANIRTGRYSCFLTQAELGKLIGVTGTAIDYWECATNMPKLPVFLKLCRALQCTPNDLLGWGDA